jgi:colanic acid biosynthesis glycosyl transferase WcaI
MKVVLVTNVFPPEHNLGAPTAANIAEELTRRGHSVHVFAPFPSHPIGRIFPGYRRTLYSTSIVAPGYKLTHCFGTFSRTSTMVSRFASNLSYGITSGLRVLVGGRPDLIFTQSWPIFANGIVTMVAALRGVPQVLRVQDMYPESLESQSRVTRRNLIYRAIREFDRLIALSSSKILVISPVFRRLYEEDRHIPSDKLRVVQNWVDDESVESDPSAGSAFRRMLGIPENAFVAVYAGNVGVAANVETVVQACAKLKELGRIYVVIAGEGTQLGACRELIQSHGLDRVIIHSPWKAEETQAVLKMADVLLLPTKATQSLISVPSKLISYFMAARPVIAGVLSESDTASAIRDGNAGWVIAPESTDQMAAAIVAASEHSAERLSQMGHAGQRYALEHLSRSSNLPRIVRMLEMAAGIGDEPGIRQQRVISH